MHLEHFVAFFSGVYMLRNSFVKIFQQNMNLNQRNLKGVPIDLKLNNLVLSGNTAEFKTLPTRPRSLSLYFLSEEVGQLSREFLDQSNHAIFYASSLRFLSSKFTQDGKNL